MLLRVTLRARYTWKIYRSFIRTKGAKNKSVLAAGHDSFPLTTSERLYRRSSHADLPGSGRQPRHLCSGRNLFCGEKFAGEAPDKPSLTLLYPLYEIDRRLVSNSYAIGGTLVTRGICIRNKMRLAYSDRTINARGSLSKPRRFWQFIGRALDAYSLQRTKRAVAERTLRRCNLEVARYRRLLRKQDSACLDPPSGKLTPCKVGARRGR